MKLPTPAKTEKDTDWNATKVEIERRGAKIILPSDPTEMPFDAAIAAIERIKKDEEQEFAVSEQIDAFVLDGAVAFWKAIHRHYGFASPVAKQSFFGPQPPQMLTVKTGPGPLDSIQVPWGRMVIPNFDAPVETHVTWNDRGVLCFTVSGKLKRRNADQLKKLVEKAREIVNEESIYRGKAFEVAVEDDRVNAMASPGFIATDNIRPEELILNRDIAALVEVNLLTPISKTEECRRHDIPIKRGVLLEGKYGTGKSMTATTVARTCVESGWTFILLPKVEALESALKLAVRYAPAVVFAEDIDRFLEDRDDAANDLLNLISGVISKDLPVITVLTTNYANKLDRAMLRPGRLDAVISYEPPDAEAVRRLIALYGRGLVAADEDLTAVGNLLAGQIPATIREVVERSKLAMIARGGSVVTEADLITTAQGMGKHLDLLNSEKVDKREDAVGRFSEAIYDLIRDASGLSTLEHANYDMTSRLRRIREVQSEVSNETEQRDNKLHMEVGMRLDNQDQLLTEIRKRV